MNKKKSLIVTGAAGHIGSNLVNWLCLNKPDYTVISLDDLSGGVLENMSKKSKIYIRDVGDDLTDIFEKYDVKIIYHCAAIASESLSPFMRKHYYKNNIVNSANIINYAITYNVDRFVFFSSMAVYGKTQAPFTETQIPVPNDPYGSAKLCIEYDLKCAKEMHGLRWTIVRPHSVAGENQNLYDGFRNVLSIWARQTLNNDPITIYGDGLQRRAFTYIGDIMEPLWKCATEDNTLWEVFNIGNDTEMTINDAAVICKNVYGNVHDFKILPPIYEVKDAWSDHSKAKKILGLECKTPFSELVSCLWNWAKEQPKRPLQTFDKFELEVGLYEQFK